MPTSPFHLRLHVRFGLRPELPSLVTEQLQQLGVTVELRSTIKETPRFTIREVLVSCRDHAQGEAVLKTLRTIEGAEMLTFSVSP